MEKKKKYLILEGIIYTVLSTIFVIIFIELLEHFRYKSTGTAGLAVDTIRYSFGLIPLFWGISISTFLGFLIFHKSEKHFAIKWLFILVSSSILSVFIQVFVVYYCLDGSLESSVWGELIVRKESITKLPILLALFTFIFIGSKFLIQNLKNRISRYD